MSNVIWGLVPDHAVNNRCYTNSLLVCTLPERMELINCSELRGVPSVLIQLSMNFTGWSECFWIFVLQCPTMPDISHYYWILHLCEIADELSFCWIIAQEHNRMNIFLDDARQTSTLFVSMENGNGTKRSLKLIDSDDWANRKSTQLPLRGVCCTKAKVVIWLQRFPSFSFLWSFSIWWTKNGLHGCSLCQWT